jgi:3-methyladenine DNA glycosylase/8-oxoguanine DNA glycosylase
MMDLPRGALTRLKRADPALGRVINEVGPFALQVGRADNLLDALLRSIAYQQLSGKAAATIYGRFRARLGAGEPPHPAAIGALDDEALRACGLSRQKVTYIRDLCRLVESGELSLDALGDLGDEEIVVALTKVRGFGRWSAEMFLMFQLGRLDVWPATDLGIRKGLQRLRSEPEMPSHAEAALRGDPYRPYRTVAAWYLWRSLDNGDGQGG